MEKSIVLPAFFPETKNSVKNIEEILELISNYDVSIIEFYHNKKSKKINKLLNDKKLKSIFLGAIALKNERLSLSSLDENLRRLSIEQMKSCIDRAYYYNSNSLLINSGNLPKNKDNKQDAYNIFKESIFELMRYIKNSNFAYDLKLLLEPGVFGSENKELISNTELAINLCKEIRKEYVNFGLTLDTSHIRQAKEEPIDSIKKAYEFCKNIHLANCVIKDKSSELYGDEHPPFGVKNGEFSRKEIMNIYREIINLYKNRNLTIGLEIICRNNNCSEFFKKTTVNLDFYNRKGNKIEG